MLSDSEEVRNQAVHRIEGNKKYNKPYHDGSQKHSEKFLVGERGQD